MDLKVDIRELTPEELGFVVGGTATPIGGGYNLITGSSIGVVIQKPNGTAFLLGKNHPDKGWHV